MNIFDRLQSIDKRILYVLLFFAIAFPLVNPVPLPMAIAPPTRAAYEWMKSLPDGGVLWVGGDYSASSIPELTPAGKAFVRMAFEKNMRVIHFTMWNTGANIMNAWLTDVAAEYNKQYGVDWVDIGYKPNATAILRHMTSNIIEAAGTDFYGTPLADLPLMQEVLALSPEYVDGIVELSTGSPGSATYLTYVVEQKGIEMVVACTAVSAAGDMPYFLSGQFKGLLNGMAGAAELEKLSGHPDKASASLGAQSFAHALIILFIILGNIGYIVNRRG